MHSTAAMAIAAGTVGRAVVLDGGSRDGTPAAARTAGLEVVEAGSLPPGGPVRGKGDAVWRLLGTLRDDDLLVLLDGDVVGLDARSVTALLAPLTRDPEVRLVKGVCPRVAPGTPDGLRSGRVSELVARPALQLLAPALASLADPLSGQVAVHAGTARRLALVGGYGLELAMLLGVLDAHGPAAVSEVVLAPIAHRTKDVDELVPVARDVLAVIVARLGGTALDAGAPPHLDAWVAP